MDKVCALLCVMLSLAALAVGAGQVAADDQTGDELVTTIIGLVSDKDKDLRSVGLEQVREQAKGTAATERFAALLPKLSPEAQVGLLGALAERGDAAARPAVLAALASPEQPVHLAAIAALGPLGQPADVPPLVQLLAGGSTAEKKTARASLVRLPGPAVSAAVDAELPRQTAAGRATLIGVLVDRRATGSTASLLAAAGDADAAVRAAAVTALGQLAGADHLPELVRLVLKTGKGPQRDAVERAVMLVCNRSAEPKHQAEPLLAVMDQLGEDERTALLPTLGRVGGPAALKIAEAALADSDPRRHAAGLQGLCNWPDGSIGPRLLELARTAPDASDRAQALAALIRVAPLPDKRPDAQKLALMKQAMAMATRDDQRKLIIKRVRAIRTMEALHFVLPYMEQPEFAQVACETVVELAHHKELRQPNKAEFDKALDQVISTSRDADVVDRANRYKKGQTRGPAPAAGARE